MLLHDSRVELHPLDDTGKVREVSPPDPDTAIQDVITRREAVIELVWSASACRWLGCSEDVSCIVWEPLFQGAEVFGLLAVACSGRSYTDKELSLLQYCAAFLTPVAQNLRLGMENQALERQVAEREHFVNILFHELKTSLTPIVASTGMLRESLKGKVGGAEERLLSNISRAAENLESRITRLVELVMPREKPAQAPQSWSVNPVLEEVLLGLEAAIKERDVAVALDVPESLPPVTADHDRVRQVIAYLLDSAIELSPQGGDVAVLVGVRGGELAITITDDGPAIIEESLDTAAGHVKPVDRQLLPGLNLGLAVCRRIIESQHGRLWLRHQGNKGNIITIFLPVITSGNKTSQEE